jgi:hypothetical protein
MTIRLIRATVAAVVLVACLSAPFALALIGSQFRIAAQMAAPSPVASVAGNPAGDKTASMQIAAATHHGGQW